MTRRLPARPCPPPDERFWAKVDKNGTGRCWLWRGNIDPSTGYGRIGRLGMIFKAHRIAYVHAYGEHDAELVIDHLCRVRNCVNPAHLEAVPFRENLLRGDSACQSHSFAEKCPLDHPYTPDNTYRRPDGARICRACKNAGRRVEKRRAQERKRLGLSPGQPGRPRKNHTAALAALTKVGG